MRARSNRRQGQGGVVLVEVLIAVLIFSIGILGLVHMQASAIQTSGDAKARTEASYLAGQMISQMWVDRANLAAYSHQSEGSACAFEGEAAESANVEAWLGDADKRGSVLGTLPNADAQIVVDPTTSMATVTLCWRAPQEEQSHNFSSSALISG